MNNGKNETPSRQSSKLSLGSSSSVLSTDEQLDGEGPLTPTDKIQDDEDDDLSMLQADSPGSLSNEEALDEESAALLEQEDDDLQTEQDSASPLSSIPDDFPLSRSASPEPSQTETVTKTTIKETVKKTVESKTTETKKTTQTKTVLRKRRKEPTEKQKKPKQEKQKVQEKSNSDEASDQEQEPVTKKPKLETPEATENEVNGSRRRRASRPETETRSRRKSRQEEPVTVKKEQEDKDKEIEMAQVSITNEHENEATNTNGTAEPIEEQESPESKENEDDDYEQKRKEAFEALTQIEIEFARLRDKIYQEKMTELNEEAVMIANGTHPELVTLMAEIEEKKGKRISSAEAWKKHQHANFKHQFEECEYEANIHFITQRTALRRDLLSSLQGKKWSIEDERAKLKEQTQDSICPNRRELLVHKRERKEEIDELQDIKRMGFPMAPDPSGLSTEDVDEDLKKLGINL